MVIDGARLVPKPALPVLPPSLTVTRSTSTAAAYSMTVRGVVAVDDRGVAGAADAQQGLRGADAAAGVGHARRRRAPGRASRARAAPRRRRGRTARAGSGSSAGTRTPARAAMVAASLPTIEVSNRPPGKTASRTRSRSPSSSRCAPCRLISRSSRSATASSTMSTLSLVQSTELSNALLATSFFAARCEVGGRVDEHRDVARADADGRVAGGVGRADDRDAAGGEDHVGALVGHQRVDQRDRRLLDHLDDAVRRAGGDGRLGEHPGGVGAALLGRRVRADHDRVAGQQRRAAP